MKKVPQGAHLGAKMGQVAAKMALSCPTWRQDGPIGAKMCPRWQPWKLRWPTWRTFGSMLRTFFGSWARSCQKLRKAKKRRQYNTFEGFLGCWGSSWKLCWAILALCWLILSYLELSWRHLATIWRQNGTKERQDEPTWRPRSPR